MPILIISKKYAKIRKFGTKISPPICNLWRKKFYKFFYFYLYILYSNLELWEKQNNFWWIRLLHTGQYILVDTPCIQYFILNRWHNKGWNHICPYGPVCTNITHYVYCQLNCALQTKVWYEKKVSKFWWKFYLTKSCPILFKFWNF